MSESTATKVKRNEQDISLIEGRVSSLEKDSWTLAKDSERLEEILLELKNIVGSLNDTISKMQLKPAEQFENYKTYILTTITGIVIAFIMGKYL